MALYNVFFVFLAALILTGIFAIALGRPGPWAGWWWFPVIVFFGGLLALLWIPPMGPRVWGVAWLPILGVTLLFALLLAAATPDRQARFRRPGAPLDYQHPAGAGEAAATSAATALGVFFWMFLAFMALVILVGLLF